MGCCSGAGPCSGIPTTCAAYDDTCGPSCKADPLVLKWYASLSFNLPFSWCFQSLYCSETKTVFSSVDPSLPNCGTYSFYGGTYLYNCESYNNYGFVSSVEFLDHFYITAIGSSYVESTATGTVARETSKPSSTRSITGTTSNDDDKDNGNGHTSLSSAAIGGIIAGAGCVLCVLVGLLVWFCIRRRKRARLAASQQLAQHAAPTYNPQGGAPMQQQQTGYQSVPQQDNNFYGNSHSQPPQGYFGGPTDPSKNSGPYAHVSPVGSPAPSTVDPAARPFSTVSSQHPSEGGQTAQGQQHLSPPIPGYAGPLAGGVAAQDYYKQPQSPNVNEVDGTQGNPGVPQGYRPGPNEVDGTQGNPGVPYTHQQHPGPYEMH